MATIVVGIDGSEGGQAALEYAAAEAVQKGAGLRVVAAYVVPPLVIAGVAAESGYFDDARSESREHAGLTATEAVEWVNENYPSLPCEAKVIPGQPAKVILEQAKDAVLIVVGSRGHGGFSGLLLGSTSHQVVQHADRPVVVVPMGSA